MATIITVNGLSFGIESDGWAGHDSDRDVAADRLESALRRMSKTALTQLHAGLKLNDDVTLNAATDLCYKATSAVTKKWHDPSGPTLFLSAQ